MTREGVDLLGTVRVRGDQGAVLRGKQPSMVLAYLVLERHRPIAREDVADLLWPDRTPPHWAGAVRGVVSKVRAALAGQDILTVSSQGGMLRAQLAEGATVDIEQALRAATATDDAELERAAITMALPFLPWVEGGWVHHQRRRLAAARRTALLALSERRASAGHVDEALADLALLVEADPFDEEAIRRAIALHIEAGQRSAAIALYDELQRRLDDELGVRPAPQTEAQLLHALGPAPSPARSARPSVPPEGEGRSDSWLGAHLRQAGAAGAAGAVRSGLRAGQIALEQSAWSTAAAELRAAAALATDEADRLTALVALGQAERCRADPASARAALDEALEGARRAGSARHVAQAVLGLVGGGGRGVATDLPDAARAELLREAAAGLCSADEDLLVPIRCELALALVLTPGTAAERARLVDDAIAAARRTAVPDLVATALLGRRTVRVDAVDAQVRLRDAERVLDLPLDRVAPPRRLAALIAAVEDLLTLGRRLDAEVHLARAEEEAASYGHPYWSWSVTCWRALASVIDGDLDAAEAHTIRALGHQAEHPEAIAAFGVLLVDIRLHQDRAEEVVALLAEAADANRHIPAYRAVLALCAAAGGDPGLARRVVDDLSTDGFASLPPDSNRFLALAVLCDAATRVGADEHRRTLQGLLTPYAGLDVVLNCYGGGGAWWGPVDRFLEAHP